MSILSTASRLNTANQLTTWNTQCIQAMQNAKTSFTSIATQRAAMLDNVEYTPEDIAEVDAMLVELNTMAVSLTVSQPIITPEATPVPAVVEATPVEVQA